MRKLRELLMVAMAALLMVGCGKNYEITVTPASHEFGYQGGDLTVSITTKGDWSVTAKPDWVIVSEEIGSKDGSVVLTVAPNTEKEAREAILEFATKTHSAQVSLRQDCCAESFVEINPTSLEVPYQGGEFQVEVTANCRWSVTMVPEWIAVAPESGESGNQTVTFTIAPNVGDRDLEPRSANVVFAGESSLVILAVSQEIGEDLVVSVTPEHLQFTCEGGTETIAVASSSSWSVSNISSWLAVDMMEGTGNAQLALTAQPNVSYFNRLGRVVFRSESGMTTVVTVEQEAAPNPHYFSVDPEYINMPSEGGEATVTVACDREWNMSCDADWVVLPFNDGSGDVTFSIAVEPNDFVGTRTAMLTVKVESSSKTVTILQESGTTVPEATLSPDTLFLIYEQGTKSISVASNAQWELRSTDDWVTPLTLYGSNDMDVTVRFRENLGDRPRYAMIEVYINDERKDVMQVVQDCIHYSLSTNVTEIAVSAEGGKYPIEVYADQAWQVFTEATWIHFDAESGTGDFSLGITMDANNTPADRTAEIMLKGYHEGMVVISVTQSH